MCIARNVCSSEETKAFHYCFFVEAQQETQELVDHSSSTKIKGQDFVQDFVRVGDWKYLLFPRQQMAVTDCKVLQVLQVPGLPELPLQPLEASLTKREVPGDCWMSAVEPEIFDGLQGSINVLHRALRSFARHSIAENSQRLVLYSAAANDSIPRPVGTPELAIETQRAHSRHCCC